MSEELETRIRRRASEMWKSEGRPKGFATRHWLAAELEVREEDENAAVSRWAAPVRDSYVERSNQAARTAEASRHRIHAADMVEPPPMGS